MSIYWVITIGFVSFWIGFASCGLLSFNNIWEGAQEAKEREIRIKNMLEEIKDRRR